mgnify:CR=1 FL=1
MELNQENVQLCIRKGLPVIQGNAETELHQFPDQSFDYVVLSQTLQAFYNPEEVLKNLLRIGKAVIVSIPNFGYWKVRIKLLFFGENNESITPPNYTNILSEYLKYVNFWDNDPGYYIELIDKESISYQKYPKGDPEWRRVVIRYSSVENAFGNKSVRDLEIQLKDKTPPTIQKNLILFFLLKISFNEKVKGIHDNSEKFDRTLAIFWVPP